MIGREKGVKLVRIGTDIWTEDSKDELVGSTQDTHVRSLDRQGRTKQVSHGEASDTCITMWASKGARWTCTLEFLSTGKASVLGWVAHDSENMCTTLDFGPHSSCGWRALERAEGEQGDGGNVVGETKRKV